MIVKATSTKKGIDLRDRCGNLQLRPACDVEAELLSAIYRAMTFGGTITAKPDKEKGVKVKWNRS